MDLWWRPISPMLYFPALEPRRVISRLLLEFDWPARPFGAPLMRLRVFLAAIACASFALVVDAADIPPPRERLGRAIAPVPRNSVLRPVEAPSPHPAPVRLTAVAPNPRNYDIPAPRRMIAPLIDHYIDAAIAEAGITPAGQADDATLVRRLTLDLVGRIPTISEVDAYAIETRGNSRTRRSADRVAGVCPPSGRALRGHVQPQTAAAGAALNTSRRVRGKPWDQMFAR